MENLEKIRVIKKDGTKEKFDVEKIIVAVNKSAQRVMVKFSEEEENSIREYAIKKVKEQPEEDVPIETMHSIVETVLDALNGDVAKSYRDYRNYKHDFVDIMDSVYKQSQKIRYIGDRENANRDSSLVSTTRSLIYDYLNTELYKKFFLTTAEKQAQNDGYVYIHDKSARLDTINCCLFNLGDVLKGGFEMGNIWYNEPKTLDTAFDVMGDVVLSAASQQYGGFTVPQIDKVLAPYAGKSFEKHCREYMEITGEKTPSEKCKQYAFSKTKRECEQGYQGIEYKLNTVGSSRGDYPFTTITFGLGTGMFEKMISKTILEVHMEGQGKHGAKRPVLFPKLVFLYNEELHGPGKELEDVFEVAILCSSKTMYPDWLSLTGDGYVPSMYKKYKKVISPMGCVDGQEIITYKFNGSLYVESFERMWNRITNEIPDHGQRYENDIHRVVDLNGADVTIYDTVMEKFVKVKYINRNMSKNWCDVTIENGRKLRTTSDHPFETQRGVVYAEDLTKDDIVKVNISQYSEATVKKSKEEAWLNGFMLCNGNYQNYSVFASVANEGEEDIEAYYIKCFGEVFGLMSKTVYQRRGNKETYKDIRTYSDGTTKLCGLVNHFTELFGGIQKKYRHIPDEVFSYTKSAKYAFLAGMIDANGYINDNEKHKRPTVQLENTNKELALQQMALAQSLGMPAKLYTDNCSDGNKKTKYRVEFKPDTNLIINIVSENKKTKCEDILIPSSNLDEYGNYENNKTLFDALKPNTIVNRHIVSSNTTVERHIVSVEQLNIKQYSYDVTTHSEHFEVSGVYSHNCRAFLSPWYERGGMEPADENDEPVFEGRFNLGVVSLHLPMILAKARQEDKDFYEVLDYYLELIRGLHKRTFTFLGEKKASCNPLGFMQGGFYNGYLEADDKIKPLLKPMTMSFGITALNELQELYNGKSLVEDGQFALEVMEYINDYVQRIKHEDGILYAIYGTPAESLCFEGNTLVKTPDGLKKIKDMRAGDIVYAYDSNDDKIVEKKVVAASMTKANSTTLTLSFSNGENVRCTFNHPFGKITRENEREYVTYTDASNLNDGDLVKTMVTNPDGTISTSEVNLVKTSINLDLVDVYNIEVEGLNNYFVGEWDGILVHNCGLQTVQFRNKYGIVPNVSERSYVSNSFHCGVWEDITPIEKQDLEGRFWNYFNGGKIQYCKYPLDYNIEAERTLIRRAMKLGYYEGVNLSLAYCEDCGYEQLDMNVCPTCGSKHITKINRMNGYLGYTRVHGHTRYNDAKNIEIKERKSM